MDVQSRYAVVEALLSLFRGWHPGNALVEAGKDGELLADSLLYSLLLQMKASNFSESVMANYSSSIQQLEDPRRAQVLYQEQVVQLLCQLLNTSFEQFLGVLMMSRNPKTIEGLSKPANSNGCGNGSGGSNPFLDF